MLKYYSYYSVGGYKDMFLGNSEMKEKETYFLPLLPIWQKKAEENNDKDLEKKVNDFKSLPSIKILSKNELYGFPKEANNIITHGAYKIIYYQTKTGEYVLSIRDIEGTDKDESGRSIPFLIAIVGDSNSDKSVLDRLCSYMATNLDATTKFMSQLFKYDWEKNGIYFRLHDLTEWIKEVVKTSSNIINTTRKQFVIDVTNKNAFVVIPGGLNDKIAIKEQALQSKKVYGIPIDEITLEAPNPDKKKRIIVAVSVGIALLIGLILIIVL